MSELTTTQNRVLDFVRDHIALHGYPPTRWEISRHFRWRSANAAEAHLKALARRGIIQLIPAISRGIALCQTREAAMT